METTMNNEEVNMAVVDAIIHKHNVQRGAVIPVLQEVQDTYGYVPPEAVFRVAETVGIPASEIFGIVSFYSQFRLKPLGKHVIRVCHGTACHLNGAENISEAVSQVVGAREGETSEDGNFTVERVACLGCCSLAPCVTIDGEIHGRLTPEKVRKTVTKVRKEARTDTPSR